jgi:hypothetical protein
MCETRGESVWFGRAGQTWRLWSADFNLLDALAGLFSAKRHLHPCKIFIGYLKGVFHVIEIG